MTKNNHRHSHLHSPSKHPRHSRMILAGFNRLCRPGNVLSRGRELKLIILHTYTLLFLILTLTLMSCSQNQTPPTKQITICPTNGEWCESTINKNTIAILLPKKIPYLKPFPVQVKIQTKNKTDIQKIQLQFSMQGMEMGMNQFNLKQQDNNKQFWQKNVVLPVCIAGRKDWLIEIFIKSNKATHKSNFLITIE